MSDCGVRNSGWGVTAVLAFCVWACSGQVIQTGLPDGAGGLSEGQAGAAAGGQRPTASIGGHGPAAGEAGLGLTAGEGGEGGAGGEGGEGGEGGGAAGSRADSGSAGQTYNFWNCEQTGDDGFGGAGGAPSWPLPSSPEATLSQLVGDWVHDGTIENSGDIDYFHFNADATGSQATETLFDTPDGWTTKYEGAFQLADHQIVLDSTAGTYHYWEFRNSKYVTHDTDLPEQVIHYGYSYDERTDTLYLNTPSCSEPVPFTRFEP